MVDKKIMPIMPVRRLTIALLLTSLLSACEGTTPPDSRAPVTLPLYTQGDADQGALIYQDACGQCHQLNAGLNKKGRQLMRIYGAPAAQLEDYTYSEALEASGWIWDAETLDPYIADVEKAMPKSKMLADPMPDATERADVIAYLSTLRVDASISNGDANKGQSVGDRQHIKMNNEAVEVLAGDENKAAAKF